MIIYDSKDILQTLIDWINDVTLLDIHTRYVHTKEEIDGNLGEPSKSYIKGQFYVDRQNNVYLSYLLDPNIIWGEPNKAKSLYEKLDDYIMRIHRFTLLCDLRFEILCNEDSNIEAKHGKRSKCKMEETNQYLFDDTSMIWKSYNGQYRFIRNPQMLINDKYKKSLETGRINFDTYTSAVHDINRRYNFKEDNDSLLVAFEEYKELYHDIFGRNLTVIEEDQIVRFNLLNWTDYSIKTKVGPGGIPGSPDRIFDTE